MSAPNVGQRPRSPSKAFLGLGSSLGDRLKNLQEAVDRLKHYDIRISAVSRLYESQHIGLDAADSDRYPAHLNAVVAVETLLPPEELLDAVQAVEEAGGRERLLHWGPRTIDIDILAYDTLEFAAERLTLPHAEIARRAFVARPLLDVAPDFKLPGGALLRERLHQEPMRSQHIHNLDVPDWPNNKRCDQ